MSTDIMRSLRDTAQASNMLAEEATRKVVEVMKENASLRQEVETLREALGETRDVLQLLVNERIGGRWLAEMTNAIERARALLPKEET